jgi:hypothetical protein
VLSTYALDSHELLIFRPGEAHWRKNRILGPYGPVIVNGAAFVVAKSSHAPSNDGSDEQTETEADAEAAPSGYEGDADVRLQTSLVSSCDPSDHPDRRHEFPVPDFDTKPWRFKNSFARKLYVSFAKQNGVIDPNKPVAELSEIGNAAQLAALKSTEALLQLVAFSDFSIASFGRISGICLPIFCATDC